MIEKRPRSQEVWSKGSENSEGGEAKQEHDLIGLDQDCRLFCLKQVVGA